MGWKLSDPWMFWVCGQLEPSFCPKKRNHRTNFRHPRMIKSFSNRNLNYSVTEWKKTLHTSRATLGVYPRLKGFLLTRRGYDSLAISAMQVSNRGSSKTMLISLAQCSLCQVQLHTAPRKTYHCVELFLLFFNRVKFRVDSLLIFEKFRSLRNQKMKLESGKMEYLRFQHLLMAQRLLSQPQNQFP